MLPFLIAIADDYEHSVREIADSLAQEFNLTEEQRKELLPSGTQARFTNRVGWVRTALKKAGLLESTKIGHVQITKAGQLVLDQKPPRIDIKFLMQFPGFVEYRTPPRPPLTAQPLSALAEDYAERSDPRERLEDAYKEITEALAVELLDRAKASSPRFFEIMVVDLLVAMGYGGSRNDAGTALGRSGDGGVDGVIKEDELGLDMIFVQAKRYTTASVPAHDIRDFVGALVGKRARKGVFITTSTFSAEALEFARHIEGKSLVLIDGTTFSRLMVKHKVGASVTHEYRVSKLDDDYFEEVDR